MTDLPAEKVLDIEKNFPLVLEAPGETFDFASWIRQHRGEIEARLLQHGSLLLKNFRIDTTAKFETLARSLCDHLYSGYGDLPTHEENQQLYHATPYTASHTIYFHNEASHTSKWPLKQFFLCVQAAEKGGELRVSDGRAILRSLSKNLVREFIDKRLVYVRNFVPYVDVRWQDFFKINDKAQLETFLRERSIEFDWKGDVLQTRIHAPALAIHPGSKELVWFNQIQLHHPRMLDAKVYSGLKSLFGKESEFPRYVCFGDGTPISAAVVDEISHALDQHATNIAARNGDVIFNDNMLVAHSRLPYQGPRKVCVALGDPVDSRDVDTALHGWAHEEPDSSNSPGSTPRLRRTDTHA
jgi:Taurine catabolism dioxygenase TauD, TfdA family